MNQAFYEHAMQRIDDMAVIELGESLIAAGFDVVLRQYPEPKPEPLRIFHDYSGSMKAEQHSNG